MSVLRILHQAYLRNGAWGGMEKSLAGFIEATRDDPEIENFIVENLRNPAAGVQRALLALSAPARELRQWHGVPLPARPAALRRRYRQSAAVGWKINRVLNWNQAGDMEPARLARRIGAAAIYWERGSAWFTDLPRSDPAFASGYDLYLANSEASRQMLRQLWQVQGEIQVCTPAIAPAQTPAKLRRLPWDRPLRLGFSARLRAFKGGVLAVHALHALADRGVRAELWVAGDGPDRARMQAEAERLGIAAQLRFLGWIGAMDSFLDDIDVLLHPALREPYGISCAEALSKGLPVVATRVDGLPEVVEDGVSGYCVTPTLPLADYAQFGGDPSDVYPLVFRPERGVVAEPGLPDPQQLADALARLAGDASGYARFSAAACAAGQNRFSYSAHLHRIKALLHAAGGAAPVPGYSLRPGIEPS